jgi:hypothetical protein
MGSLSRRSSTTPVYGAQIEGAARDAQGVYNANAGNLAGISQGLNAQIPGLTARAFGDQPGVAQAQQYAQDTLGGKYLNNNPYVNDMVSLAREGAGDSINSYFGRSGRVGGGNHQERLAQGLSEAELGVRSGIYSQERQLQQNAAGMVPGLAQAQYAGIPTALQTAQVAAELPYTGVNNNSRNVGGLLGQYTNQRQSGGLGSLLLQAGGNLAGAFAGSDARLKTRIQKISQESDGLGIYDFDYIDDMPDGIAAHCPKGRQRGVMASEVAKLRPWALGPVVDGFATVNYNAL